MSHLINCPHHGVSRVYPAVGQSAVCPKCDPGYGVPTGVVPRVSVNIDPEKGRYAQVFVSESGDATVRYTDTLPTPVDPVQKAVDDYLLMERKARAWDELMARGYAVPVDLAEALVHPAHVTAPATT